MLDSRATSNARGGRFAHFRANAGELGDAAIARVANTFQPARANSSTSANPIPPLLPVIKTVSLIDKNLKQIHLAKPF